MTKVIFFGNERLATGVAEPDVSVLEGLIKHGYEVVAIVAHDTLSKTRKKRPLKVQAIAQQHNIPIYLPNRPSDIYDKLLSFQADIAVLVAYGRIISQAIIDIFPKGIINIHPSLLPKYRGPTPIESVILNGDKQTGVSIMKLTSGMDEGPVYTQRTIELSDSETKLQLATTMSKVASSLLFEKIDDIIDGRLQPDEQNHIASSYSRLIKKSDGIIDWRKSAIQIEREIRAYSGWPNSQTTIGRVNLAIISAQTSPEKQGQPGDITIVDELKTISVATNSGSIVLNEVKPNDKKEMPIKAFLAGYRNKLINN